MRMGMRRFTRLTNGFFKKIENHAYAVALHLMYLNFVRVHSTLRVTPAMESGLCDHVWDLSDLVADFKLSHCQNLRSLAARRNRSHNHILCFDAKMGYGCQQMSVIGIDHGEARLGSSCQVNGIGSAQKHRCRQSLIGLPDSQENLAILGKPLKCSCFDVCFYLPHQGSIGLRAEWLLRAACDERPPSFRPARARRTPHGRLPPVRAPDPPQGPDNRDGQDS